MVGLRGLRNGLASTGERIALNVNKLVDAQSKIEFATAIEALAGAAFDGSELRELRLPKAQHRGGHAAEASDFADAIVEAIRDGRAGIGGLLFPGATASLSHAENSLGRRVVGAAVWIQQ